MDTRSALRMSIETAGFWYGILSKKPGRFNGETAVSIDGESQYSTRLEGEHRTEASVRHVVLFDKSRATMYNIHHF